MEESKKKSLKAQFDIIISQLKYLMDSLEQEKLLDEQVVLDFLDELNEISVKH